MQLDALLASYFHFVQDPSELVVLYHASSNIYKEAYDRLIENYGDFAIDFVEEKQFKDDLIALFEKIESSKVLFLVDDLMFKNKVNFQDFIAIDTNRYVPSLRMGQHLKKSYTTGNHQALPSFSKEGHLANMLSWDYFSAEYDWAYPLSVDGHLFNKREIKVFVDELEYKAPNSFEEALQLAKPFYKDRKGLCYEKSIIINNPCNKVQSENDNISGNLSIEELNQSYLNGFRINFKSVEGIENISAHQEVEVELIKS